MSPSLSGLRLQPYARLEDTPTLLVCCPGPNFAVVCTSHVLLEGWIYMYDSVHEVSKYFNFNFREYHGRLLGLLFL